MFALKIFSFTALWSPYLLVFLIILWGVAITFIHEKKERICATIAVCLFYLTKGSPLDLLGHISFMFHMIQMALLFIVLPPLVWHGLPLRLVTKIVHTRAFLVLSKPVLALLLFNAMFSFYHVPFIFDFVKVSMIYHNLAIAFLFILALTMWWHIFDRVDNGHNISGLPKIAYIFGNGILLTPACALIILSSTPLYATYSDPSKWLAAMALCVSPAVLQNLHISGPEFFLGTNVVQDQQNGGVIMKVLQELVYGVFLAITFFKWFAVEKVRADAETKQMMQRLNMK